MMCIYMLCHFGVFARTDSYNTFKRLGIVYTVVLFLEIFGAVATAGFASDSICKDESLGTAAIMTSAAIIVINLFTLIASSIYFQTKTFVSQSRVAVHSNNDQSNEVV